MKNSFNKISLTTAFLITFFSILLKANGASQQFQIEPYFYFHAKQHVFATSWQYTDSYLFPHSITMQLFNNNGQVVQTITASLKKNVYTALLPENICQQNIISYSVPGFLQTRRLPYFPCSTIDNTTTMAFISDTHDGGEYSESLLHILKNIRLDGILHGGDAVHSGHDYDKWITYFSSYKELYSKYAIFQMVGNHEYKGGDDTDWSDFFSVAKDEAFYSYQINDVLFVVLNSCMADDSSLIQKQLGWVKEQLKRPVKWKIMVFHHPLYSRGIAHSAFNLKDEHGILQKYYEPIFTQNKIDLVLSGHTHIFEDSLKNNLHHITTSTIDGSIGYLGGDNPYSQWLEQDRGFILFKVANNQINLSFINLDGKEIHQLTIHK